MSLWLRWIVCVAVTTGCARRVDVPTPSPTSAAKPTAASAPKTPPKEPRSVSTHPGSFAYSAEVAKAIADAVAKLPSSYRPRTRHYDGKEHKAQAKHVDPNAPKGVKPNYTNRLILETSPYLRQHAHNPVDWRPWGAAAFEEARRLGRPIFLSVGYSTCHWCHVMEHESFEDLEIAYMLNSMYVPIKVDREERPDVDAIYMAAVHAMRQGGGWPMSVWIAPGDAAQRQRGLPFYAGTYFPPRDGARGRRPGFLGLARTLAERYAQDPKAIVAQGQSIAARVRQQLEAAPSGPVVGTEGTDALAKQMAERFDPVYGGTKRAPKFPSNVPHRVLLRHHLRTGDVQSRKISHFTLLKMLRGGIYDHVGGGFARYSTDARWLVPHFEKMLYDQALIGQAMVDALQATGDPQLAVTLRETLDYLLREMRHTTAGKPGPFYSATDADSEGEEGKFFLFTPAQLEKILGPADAALIAQVYDVRPGGNFEGRSILNRGRSWTEEAGARKLASEALRTRCRGLLDKLYAARSERIPPLRDDKILTSWNGLLIGTMANAGFVLGEPRFIAAAAEAADYILTKMTDGDGRLLRTAFADRARGAAYLDDYAFFIQGLLDLFEATGAPERLEQALKLQEQLDDRYADKRGGYFATSSAEESLLAREKPDYDGAEPSGNSVAALNLARLWSLTGEHRFKVAAERTIAAFYSRLSRYPMAMTEMWLAVEFLNWHPKELVLVRPQGSDSSVLAPFLKALRARFIPHHVRLLVEEGPKQSRLSRSSPVVGGKVARKGKVTAYVCTAQTCKLPTTDPAVMIKQLTERPRAPK